MKRSAQPKRKGLNQAWRAQALAEACGLDLEQPITGRQNILLTDAGFSTSGYALIIEENDKKKLKSKKNTILIQHLDQKCYLQRN